MKRSLVTLFVLAACSNEGAPPAAPVAAAPATTETSSSATRWVTARAPHGSALLEAPAQVLAAPASRAVIAPPLRARIVAVRAVPGATVAAGAPLVDVVIPEAAAAAAAYRAASDELAAHARRAEQLGALRKEGLARGADLASVELELARLRGARDVAATTLRAAGFAVAEAGALAASGGRTTLRAPVAGTVVAVDAVVGASRDAEDVVVELAGDGATRVEARLPRALPADAAVEVVLPGAAPLAAKLVGVAPTRDPDGTMRAWFELATPAPAGAQGRVRARVPDGQAAIVPASALGRDRDGAFVWRREHDQPRRVVVQVLAASGADALVEGIAVGDAVAADAAAVTPTTPTTSAAREAGTP